MKETSSISNWNKFDQKKKYWETSNYSNPTKILGIIEKDKINKGLN